MSRLAHASVALGLGTVCAAFAAACASDPASGDDVASPCVAFERGASPRLRVERVATGPGEVPVKVVAAAGRTYVLSAAGGVHVVGASTTLLTFAGEVRDLAVRAHGSAQSSSSVQAFVLRAARTGSEVRLELVRYDSADAGQTFDAATEKVMLRSEAVGETAEPLGSLAFGPDGYLYVATGTVEPPDPWLDPRRLLGKILRLDVSGEEAVAAPGNAFSEPEGRPEIWATGARAAHNFDVDPELGDVWFTDLRSVDGTSPVPVVQRIGHAQRDVITPFFPTAVLSATDVEIQQSGAHVYRGRRVPALRGRYVALPIKGVGAPVTELVAFDRYGPSGPPQSTSIPLDEPVVGGVLGRDADGELVVATAEEVGRVVDDTQGQAGGPPSSLLATKCFDLASASGAPLGAIRYDVRSALWSDGAAKERFVVVPKGATLRANADGDLVFPVGTVAVKTFAVDGKRVETRLLVQHAIESWIGYSYAWNAQGTDAELVTGNRAVALPGGRTWYFPSSADCEACHTPAAGYTLGLEARQLVGRGDAFTALSSKLTAPLDLTGVTPLDPVDAPPPTTVEQRARSYLHANCSICHREGSATGSQASLDLRSHTPLAATGLCTAPKVDAMGIPDARIVAPRDPARSILLARMRTVDDRRMPKLASNVVDEAGAAAIEAWIRDLASCP